MRGSIIRRGKKYSVVVTIGKGPNGDRQRDWHSGYATRDEAEQALTKLLSDIDAGTYIPPERITLKEFIENEWLPSLDAGVAGGSLKQTTVTNYKFLANRYVVPQLGHMLIRELNAPSLNKAYGVLLAGGGRKGRPLSRTTVRSVHVAVHKMLGDAIKWGRVIRNVAENADAPRKADKAMKTWTAEQVQLFLKIIEDEQFRPFYMTLATTGLRRGEASALTIGDVDLGELTINVDKAPTVSAYMVIESTPKTTRSKRTIAIDPQTATMLKTHLVRRKEMMFAAGMGRLKPTDPMFTWADGRAVHPETFTKTFTRLVKNAKLPAIRLHDLRHSWATAALEAGVPLKIVSEHMGHRGIQVTADTYSHVAVEVDREANDGVARRILGDDTDSIAREA